MGAPRFVQIKRRNQAPIKIYEVSAESLYIDVEVIRIGSSPSILVREHIDQTHHRYTVVNPATRAKMTLALPSTFEYEGSFQGNILGLVHDSWHVGGETIGVGGVVAIPYLKLGQSASPLTGADISLLWKPSPRGANSNFSRDLIGHVGTSHGAIYLSVLDNVQGKLIRIRPAQTGWRQRLERIFSKPTGAPAWLSETVTLPDRRVTCTARSG